jgi:hypothetical protein
MAKPTKRKASEADASNAQLAVGERRPNLVLLSLDLSNSKTTPRVVADALLSLLPNGATSQDDAAKKLVKAFPLLIAELDARSSAMARANESEGTRLPIVVRFPSGDTVRSNNDDDICEADAMTVVIRIPEECLVKILTFLNGYEVVNVSCVSKAWLSVSRMPLVWDRLDASNGLSNKGRKMNLTSVVALLRRPQFANLKSLVLPCQVKLGKSGLKSIAKACPRLEIWDVGYSRSACRVKDDDLIEAAETFVNLTSIRTDMWDVSNYGIAHAAKTMGAQLLDLRIANNCICEHYLSDDTLDWVAAFCPNLKHFEYRIFSPGCYKIERDTLSGAGITRLIGGCRHLEVLEIHRAKGITRDDFTSILNLISRDEIAATDGRSICALRKIILVGYPYVISEKPFAIVDTNPYAACGGEALANDE